MVENFLELIEIDDIEHTEEYVNMVDISVEVDQSFLLSNGVISHNSASNSVRKYRDPNLMGAFSLRGKFINVSEITNQKLIQNNEAINLMAAIGLKIGKPINLKELRYGRILLFVDSDLDGNSIAALLLNFFYKYWPDMFDRGMIYKVETPILVAVKRTNKKEKILFYNNDEFNNWAKKNKVKDYEIKYKKGLAALLDDEYNTIINDPKLTLINKDDLSDRTLDIWFGKSSELRKNELLR